MLIDPKMMELAEQCALTSPCLRRKYGATIANSTSVMVYSNMRVGHCCDGGLCVRDRYGSGHGENVERGAEIHAEQAALLLWKRGFGRGTHLYLAGYGRDGKLLTGKQCRPCHTCALMIKFVGLNFVVIRNEDGDIVPVSISEIIEDHERPWSQSILDI